MTDKILKVLRAVIVAQLLIVGVFYIAGKCNSEPLFASTFKAHGANSPDNYIIPVTQISLQKEDGNFVTLWSGNQDVDLATLSGPSDFTSFNCNVPPGKYKRINIFCGPANGVNIRVKGTVVSGVTTYYTKASHTGHTTGPAEIEEFSSTALVEGYYALTQDYSPAIEIGGSSTVSDIVALVDISDSLIYYDGNGTDPLAKPWLPAKTAGMYLQGCGYAVTLGIPGSKEIYDFDTGVSTDRGRLTIVYDGTGNVIGANARLVLTNSSFGNNLLPTTAPAQCIFTDNGNGTYNLLIRFGSMGIFDDSNTLTLQNFSKATHSGTYSKFFNNATTTGSYNCTRLP